MGDSGQVMPHRLGQFHGSGEIEANYCHLRHAQLSGATQSNIPSLPAFDALRFVLDIRAKLAFGTGFPLGARQPRVRTCAAIIRPATKMPFAASR